ncbi:MULTISPECIES: hypothetical protein [unclassified Methanosarcina]|nr:MULTISPECIES: hypothetical protein [unclassified Methanosarcina]
MKGRGKTRERKNKGEEKSLSLTLLEIKNVRRPRFYFSSILHFI